MHGAARHGSPDDGRGEVADAAYRWVYSLWQAQPELAEKRLYVDTDDVGIVTKVPNELAYALVTDLNKPRQAYFNPGIGAAFLARYYMKTGVQEALPIARGLLQLSEGTEAQYDYPDTCQVGKFAWGASAMLEVEPLAKHLGSFSIWAIGTPIRSVRTAAGCLRSGGRPNRATSTCSGRPLSMSFTSQQC